VSLKIDKLWLVLNTGCEQVRVSIAAGDRRLLEVSDATVCFTYFLGLSSFISADLFDKSIQTCIRRLKNFICIFNFLIHS